MTSETDKNRQHDDSGRPGVPANEEIVKNFLRGQNLEQVGRVDEAVDLYEKAVAAGFDAAGPYDRLIFIYQQQSRHRDVVRIVELSLANVRTYPLKRTWYETQKNAANEAMNAGPTPL